MKGDEENIDKLFREAYSGDYFPVDEAAWTKARRMLKPHHHPFHFKYGVVASSVVVVISMVGAILFNYFEGNKTHINNTCTYAYRNEVVGQELSKFFTEKPNYEDNVFITDYRFRFTRKPSKETLISLQQNSRGNGGIEEKIKEQAVVMAVQQVDETKKGKQRYRKSLSGLRGNSNVEKRDGFNTEFSEIDIGLPEINNKNANQEIAFDDSSKVTEQKRLHIPNREEFIQFQSDGSLAKLNEPLFSIAENDREKAQPPLFIPFSLRFSVGLANGLVLNLSKLTRGVLYEASSASMDFGVEYHFTSNWGVQSGFTYSTLKEEQGIIERDIIDNGYFNLYDNSYWNYFDKPITIRDSTWWLGGWWYYPWYNDTVIDSNYVQVIDSNWVEILDTVNAKISLAQKITHIEIPLLITYNFVVKRWTFQMATGVSLGVFMNANGEMIRFGDKKHIVGSTRSFFQALQYNYLLSSEIGFGLTPNWRLTVGPRIKMNLNSMFNSETEHRHRYLFYGLNVGIVYRF